MNSRILALSLILPLALAGCTTIVVKGDYNFKEHPGKGLVVLSTRLKAIKVCLRSAVTVQLHFRHTARPDDTTSSVVFDMESPRFVRDSPYVKDENGEEIVAFESDRPTRFVVQEVWAGHYRLNNVQMYTLALGERYHSITLPPLTFSVGVGEVVYLGELEIDTRGEQCRFQDFRQTVRDEWKRDQKRFQAEIHNISPEVVQKRLLTDERFSDL